MKILPFISYLIPLIPFPVVFVRKYTHIWLFFIIKIEKEYDEYWGSINVHKWEYFFIEGQIYTVGNIVNKKFFEIETEDGDHWYATKDSNGIYVRFNSIKGKMSDAWFVKA